ncbi:retrovirus-related pol polyprotein from transposon TNT 1-94 [Tanacetum coccineum]
MSTKTLQGSFRPPFLKEKKGVASSALSSTLFWEYSDHDAKMGFGYYIFKSMRLHMQSVISSEGLTVTPADSESLTSPTHPFESPPVTTRKLPVVEVKRWIIASQDETIGPSVHPEDATSTKMVRETLSHADAESGGNSEKINSETDTEILNVLSTKNQLASDALWCCYHTVLSKVKPKNFKMAVNGDRWFKSMQDKIYEFDRLKVWELVPRPDYVMVIGLKWIYKVMLDEYGDVLKDKARLVAKGYRQEEGIDFEESFAPVARIE